MGAVVAGNFPLNHFVTDLHQANRTPVEVLDANIKSLERKAFACSALEKISYVALIAIMAIVFAISYTSTVLTGGLPLLLAGVVLSTPVIAWGVTKFAVMASNFSRMAEMERGVSLQLKQIEQWRGPEITQFLLEQRIAADRIPLDGLRQINRDEPLRALLPLIARFNFLRASSQEIEAVVTHSRAELEAKFREKEAETGRQIDPQIKQKNRFECQETAWRQHEIEAVPLALNAAILLDLIQNPAQQDLDIKPFSLEIPGVGSCVPKSFAERIFGRNDNIRSDDYVVFHPDLHRDPLSLQAIEQNFEPRDLRLVLLPNAIRV